MDGPIISLTQPTRLTDLELDLVRVTTGCPDCGGELRTGPDAGGIQYNCACVKCHSEFNLTCMGGEVVDGNRIGEKGPRELGERAQLYGRIGGRMTKCEWCQEKGTYALVFEFEGLLIRLIFNTASYQIVRRC